MTGLRPTNSISLPLLSVIIPAYNVAPYIRRCLDSVCGQSYPNLEIICVDDGSTDETFSILQEYAAKDSRIVLHHQNNAGQATARNWALDHAHGDFVIGADSDDYVALDCYEKAMHHMTDDVDMVIFPPHVIGHDHRRVDEVTKWFDSPFKGRFGLDGYTPSSLTNHVWNKIFRRSIIEKYHIRFPDGQWFEDIAFTLMYFSVIKWAYMMEEKLYYYLVRDASTSGLTLKKHKKLLGMFDVADFLYSFYKKNGLWKANLPQVERMLKYV